MGSSPNAIQKVLQWSPCLLEVQKSHTGTYIYGRVECKEGKYSGSTKLISLRKEDCEMKMRGDCVKEWDGCGEVCLDGSERTNEMQVRRGSVDECWME